MRKLLITNNVPLLVEVSNFLREVNYFSFKTKLFDY